MDNGSWIGTVIWAVCVFGCAAVFLGIGLWAERSDKPVHFWAGTQVDAKKVSDIAGYNHANAVMWKWYSVPYFLSGILGCFGRISQIYMIVAAILLGLACIPGLFLLVWRYLQIEKQFLLR